MLTPHTHDLPMPSPQAARPTWHAWLAWTVVALLCLAGLAEAVWTVQHQGPWLVLLGGMAAGAGLALGHARWQRHLRRRVRSRVARTPPQAVTGLRQLDERMLSQLARAMQLSETSSMQMIERVTGLRGLSARLMAYLQTAHVQSSQMQTEIERNGSIVAELAGFVQQLPQQIAQERQYLDQLVGEVRRLSGITETIRGMARQTEILSINAAIAAARAGEAGRGFSVLAGEVRRLALQSNESAQQIEQTIRQLVDTVQARSGGEFAERLQANEQEAARLLALTGKLDEGYLDMRQFYGLLLTAITEHNSALDLGITELLDTAQYQDVFKQIVDRLAPALHERHQVLEDLIARLRQGDLDTQVPDAQAAALADRYLDNEALHRDPEAASGSQPGAPAARIELF